MPREKVVQMAEATRAILTLHRQRSGTQALDMHIDDLNGDDEDGWVEVVETKVEY